MKNSQLGFWSYKALFIALFAIESAVTILTQLSKSFFCNRVNSLRALS